MTISIVGDLLFTGRNIGDRTFSSRERVGRRQFQRREARPSPDASRQQTRAVEEMGRARLPNRDLR